MQETRTLVLYGGAGAIGTAVHFAVLFAALPLAGPVIASTAGAILGCLVNFALSRDLVFASRAPYRRSLPRFVCVATLGVVVNALLMAALAGVLAVVLSQAIASITVLLLGYTLNSRWTFDER